MSLNNASIESPNNVTVIVMEDEASERLLEASCSKDGNNRKKKSIWKRFFRGSERSARSLGSRTAATSSSSNLANTRNLSFNCQDSVLSFDDENDDDLMLSNENFTMLAEGTVMDLMPAPVPNVAALEERDNIDCVEVCPRNSYYTVDEEDESPSEPFSPETQPIDVSILLEDAQEAARTGENRRSLDIYQEVLSRQDLDFTPIQMANLCYACTRLAYQLHEPETALRYAKRELAYTLKISKRRPTMAVSKCYHELACICRDGLGESDRALKFYKKALRIEDRIYQSITAQGMTSTSQAQEVLQHIQETKGCIGRILFEQGKVKEALWML